MKRFKLSRHYVPVLLVLLFFIVICILCGYTFEHPTLSLNNEQAVPLNDGWYYFDEDNRKVEITLPCEIPTPANQAVTIYHSISDDLPVPTVFCMRSSQARMSAVLEGDVIYSFGERPASPLLGQAPGSVWNLIRIPAGSDGQTISITLSSPYKEYAGKISEVFVGTKSSIVFFLFSKNIFSFLLSVLTILLGIIMMAVHLLTKRNVPYQGSTLYLSELCILLGVWLIGESRMIQFISGDYGFWFFITVSALLLFPVPLFKYLCLFTDSHLKSVFKLLWRIQYAAFVVIVFLQLAGIADFIETLQYSNLLIALTATVAIITFVCEMRWKRDQNLKFIAIAFGIMLFTGIIELIGFFIQYPFNTGTFVQLGFIASVILLSIRALTALQSTLRLSAKSKYFEMLANRDIMTDCANRRAFYNDIIEMDRLSNATIVMVDINDLKIVNDTYGHEMGDDMIKSCSKILSSVFSPQFECYRMGGDEFLLLSHSVVGADKIQSLINYTNEQCELYSDTVPYDLTLAIGYATTTLEDKSINGTITRADAAMYEAKRKMKSTVRS